MIKTKKNIWLYLAFSIYSFMYIGKSLTWAAGFLVLIILFILHATLETRNLQRKITNVHKDWRSLLNHILFSLVAAFLLSLHLYNHIFQITTLKQESMLPTIEPDSIIFVEKLSMGLAVNIVQLMDKNRHESITRWKFPYYRKLKKEDIIIFFAPSEKKVLIKRIDSINGDLYYVRGDNRERSLDSSFFGPIPEESIIGRVVYYTKLNREK